MDLDPNWGVSFTVDNKYHIFRKWFSKANQNEFVYMKDYAEEHRYTFDEVNTHDSKDGTRTRYVMSERAEAQTLLQSCLASRKAWG